MSQSYVGRTIGAIRAWWLDLGRDWQSVAIGLLVVTAVLTFGVQVPW